jgi:hypothetical protein
VRSGRPIPDERLEADPLAELTVEEAAAAEHSTLEESDDAAGLVSPSHPFEVLADADITPEEEQAGEEDDDEPAPDPSPGIRLERDTGPGSRIYTGSQDGHHSSHAVPESACGKGVGMQPSDLPKRARHPGR